MTADVRNSSCNDSPILAPMHFQIPDVQLPITTQDSSWQKVLSVFGGGWCGSTTDTVTRARTKSIKTPSAPFDCLYFDATVELIRVSPAIYAIGVSTGVPRHSETSQMAIKTVPGVQILAPVSKSQATVLTQEAQQFIATLQRCFNPRRLELLRRRDALQMDLDRGGFDDGAFDEVVGLGSTPAC